MIIIPMREVELLEPEFDDHEVISNLEMERFLSELTGIALWKETADE